jgi:hypothetical protein
MRLLALVLKVRLFIRNTVADGQLEQIHFVTSFLQPLRGSTLFQYVCSGMEM